MGKAVSKSDKELKKDIPKKTPCGIPYKQNKKDRKNCLRICRNGVEKKCKDCPKKPI